MFRFPIDTEPVLLALGLTLYHALWQGAVIGALAALGLFALRKATPQLRYATAYTALLLMAFGIGATFWWCLPPAVEPAVASPAPSHTQFLITPTRPQRPMPSPEAVRAMLVQQPAAAVLKPAPLPMMVRMDRWLYAYAPWCGMIWTAGVLLMATRFCLALMYTQSLRHLGVRPIHEDIAQRLEALAQQLGIRRVVSVLESTRAKTPCVLGAIRPVILLPAAVCCGLTPAQLDAVLIHELVHIRRHDYLLNLIQNVLLTILFFHPAAWWLNRRIRIERELSCDDFSVTTFGNAYAYAETLAALAGLARNTMTLAPAANDGSVLHRVRRILARPEPDRRNARGWAGAVTLVLICAMLATWTLGSGRLASAQSGNATDNTAIGPAPGTRTLQFPSDRSMGQLVTRPWGANYNEGWKPMGEARGTVTVPGATEVMLQVSEQAVADLSPLNNLPSNALQGFTARGTSITDDQTGFLANQTTIRSVNLFRTQTGDQTLSHLQNAPALDDINVQRTQLTDEGVSYLQNSENLRSFVGSQTALTDESVQYLRNNMNMEYFDMWRIPLTDASAPTIATWKNLEMLGLEDSRITDASLQMFAGLTNLRELVLERNMLTDEGLQYLQGLSNLQTLLLDDTYITDNGLQYLAGLPLNELQLPPNISPMALRWLQGLGIGLSDPIPAEDSFRMVSVVDKTTGAGIANATLEINAGSQDIHMLPSDESGNVRFYLRPGSRNPLEVVADAPGYATGHGKWDAISTATLTIALDKAAIIGGYVHNQQGDPVPGVTVELPLPGDRKWNLNRDQLFNATVQTDADGAFAAEGMPATQTSIQLTLSHPDYATTVYEPEETPIATLLDRSAVLIIEDRVAVSGTVKDRSGRPVANASVRIIASLDGSAHLRKALDQATANDRGEFTFDQCDRGSLRFEANAPGFATGSTETDISTGDEMVSIVLPKSIELRVRVVDSAEMPAKGALVSITAGDPKAKYPATKTLQTDGEGRGSWSDCPEGDVQIRVRTEDNRTATMSTLATPEEIIIKLEPPAGVLAGTVLDSQSLQPLDIFEIALISNEEDPRQFPRMYGQGKFRLEPRKGQDPVAIVASAAGYKTTEISMERISDQANIQIPLDPLPPLSGRVVTEQGKAVEDATVCVGSWRYQQQIVNGDIAYRERNLDGRTGPDGAFRLTNVDEGIVIAWTGDGFGTAPIKGDTAEITLHAYAYVSLTREGLSAYSTRTESRIRPNQSTQIFCAWSWVNTGQFDGQVVIENVPPGRVGISYGQRYALSAPEGEVRYAVAPGVGCFVHLESGHQFEPKYEPGNISVSIPLSMEGLNATAVPVIYLVEPLHKPGVRQWFYTGVYDDGAFEVHNILPGEYTAVQSFASEGGPFELLLDMGNRTPVKIKPEPARQEIELGTPGQRTADRQ